MPSTVQHINQWKRNRELLLRNACGDFPEWTVTIAFYCALHALEAAFAQNTKVLRFKGHTERNRYLGDPANKMLKYWHSYKVVFDASHDARYTCPDISRRFPPATLHSLIQGSVRNIEMRVIEDLHLDPLDFPHIKVNSTTGALSTDPIVEAQASPTDSP